MKGLRKRLGVLENLISPKPHDEVIPIEGESEVEYFCRLISSGVTLEELVNASMNLAETESSDT